MKTIAASSFKTHCLSLLNQVARNHQPIIITKRGKPLAKIVALHDNQHSIPKPLKGNVTYWGDVISPIDVAWEVEKE